MIDTRERQYTTFSFCIDLLLSMRKTKTALSSRQRETAKIILDRLTGQLIGSQPL